jgi:hypothetical protein
MTYLSLTYQVVEALIELTGKVAVCDQAEASQLLGRQGHQ